MWPLLIEVADVDAQDVLELAAAEDQEAVEAFAADAADPAFRVRIRVRRYSTLRVSIETKKSTYSRRSQLVSTVKKVAREHRLPRAGAGKSAS